MKVWLTAAVLVLSVFAVLTAAEINETNETNLIIDVDNGKINNSIDNSNINETRSIIESDKISAHLKYALEYGEIELEPIPAEYKIKTDGTEIKPLSNSLAIKQQEISRSERNLQRLPSLITGTIITDAPLKEYQREQLEALGVEIRSEMDTLNTANIPRDAIDDVAELEFVRFIEPAQPVRLLLDSAVPEIGAGIIPSQPNTSNKTYTGKDVIIGIVDSGIDTTHGDFWFDSNKTKSKILYLWDQTDPFGPRPLGYSYGTEYTNAEIEAGICRETDPIGHGTHVAGAAASSGKETGKYSGAAKDANIVFVKTTLWDDEIVDGLHYIVEKSKSTGLPVVISCSFGTFFNSPHDGSSPLAQAVEWCIEQGVPVVCSAGNDGDEELHATIDGPDPYGGTYNSNDIYSLEIELDSLYKESLVDLYYDLDDNLSINVSTANGSVYANETNVLGSGDNWAIAVYHTEGPSYKNYFIYAKDTHELCNQVIEIKVDTKRNRGNNRWDAWMLSEYYQWGSFADINDRDYFKSIGSPADSPNATTVGAYSTKTNWTSVNGKKYRFTNAKMNDIAYFSSRGPTRDGRMKPEIAAPGFGVMSAFSIDALPYTWEGWIDPDNAHKIAAGTSMSAPIVAGVYALYLECNPKTTPYELKNYFMNTAREDMWTETTWPKTDNQYWGSGKVWAQITSSEINIDKTVFNLNTEEWIKEITANVTEEVKFNLTVRNPGLCSNLTNITLIDVLPNGLEYIRVESETPEPNEIIPGPDGTTILRWLIERPLEPKKTIVFLINANVTKCGKFKNKLNATAITDNKIVYDESWAKLNVFCKTSSVKEINKTTDTAKEDNCTNMTKNTSI